MLNKLKSKPMEKLKFLFAIPLIGMMCLLFSFDYGQTTRQVEDQLIGLWEGTDFNFEQTEGPEINQAMIEGGRSLHEGGTFMLKNDKTYEIKDPSGKTNGQGTWSVKNGNVLVTKYTNGYVFQYQILELTDSKLITRSNDVTETPKGNAKINITLSYQKR